MPDLDVQIRSYVDASSPPLTVDEVLEVRVGDGPVRPVAPRPAQHRVRRGWLVAAAAAVLVFAVVGGVAWLSNPGSESEPAEPIPNTTVAPPMTTVAPTTVPSEPRAAMPFDVVHDAFSAIGEADWDLFLGYLDPDGVIRDGTTEVEYEWSVRVDVDEIHDPLSFDDVDYDGDGMFTRAEQLLLSANYLALAPVEVLGCEPLGGASRCLVEDSSVFFRAAGFDPDPIPVLVQDGRIISIEVSTVFAEGTDVLVSAWDSLGECPECMAGVWDQMVYQYHQWVGLIGPESVCPPGIVPESGGLGCGTPALNVMDSPLGIFDGAMTTSGGFGIFPWIDPDGFKQHQELIPQWLALRETQLPGERAANDALRELVDGYIAVMSTLDEPPAPGFDPADFGTEQPLVGLFAGPRDGFPRDEGGSWPEPSPWMVIVRHSDPHPIAEFVIDVDQTGEHYSAKAYLSLDGGGFDAQVSPPYLVIAQSNRADDRPNTYAAIGGLPPEASVVTTVLSDGTSYWQRPFAGVVMFNTGFDMEATFRVLDGDGNTILTVVTEEGTGRVVEP